MKKVVTAQFYSRMYYGSEEWLNELTSVRSWRFMNPLYHKALRVVMKDYDNLISKADLNASMKRATPRQWSYYSSSKLAINLMNGSTPLGRILKDKCYINDQNPGSGSISDTSRLKIGRYSFSNHLQCLRKIDFDWCAGKRHVTNRYKKVFYCELI